jgi:hypothetical protein
MTWSNTPIKYSHHYVYHNTYPGDLVYKRFHTYMLVPYIKRHLTITHQVNINTHGPRTDMKAYTIKSSSQDGLYMVPSGSDKFHT